MFLCVGVCETLLMDLFFPFSLFFSVDNIRCGIVCLMEHVLGHFISTLTTLLALLRQRRK